MIRATISEIETIEIETIPHAIINVEIETIPHAEIETIPPI